MTMIKFTDLTLRQSVIYMLRFFNAVNPNRSNVLTDTEIMFLTEFLLLPERFKYNRFSSIAKKRICQSLKADKNIEATPSSINPKLYSMIDKGAL